LNIYRARCAALPSPRDRRRDIRATLTQHDRGGTQARGATRLANKPHLLPCRRRRHDSTACLPTVRGTSPAHTFAPATPPAPGRRHCLKRRPTLPGPSCCRVPLPPRILPVMGEYLFCQRALRATSTLPVASATYRPVRDTTAIVMAGDTTGLGAHAHYTPLLNTFSLPRALPISRGAFCALAPRVALLGLAASALLRRTWRCTVVSFFYLSRAAFQDRGYMRGSG